MRGLLAGKCLPADMLFGENLAAYLVRKFGAMQQKLDALAAENAALKSNLMFWDAEDPESPYDSPEDIANNCGMVFNTEFEVQVAAKMPNRTYRVSEVDQYDCKIELVSGAIPETPATDSYLNSVRAEGIHFAANRMLAAWDSGFIDDTPAQAYDISGAVLSAVEFLPNASPEEFKRDFADSIRSEIKASTASAGKDGE